MLFAGWVALWRPLDFFLYEWWPIAGERRWSDRLSRIEAQIRTFSPDSNDAAIQEDQDDRVSLPIE